MKIITIEVARAGLFIPVNEILPLTGIFPPTLCNEIAQRYSFLYPPDFSQPISMLQEKGLEFVMGKFHFNDEDHTITQMSLLPAAGLVVSAASNTEIAKEFITDLLIWGIEKHDFRVSAEMFDKVFYLSQVVVELNGSIDHLIAGIRSLTENFAEMFQLTYGIDVPIHHYSFVLNYDRTKVGGDLKKLASFAMERRIDEPYELHRYFCQAPLRTDDHIRLLETFESLLEAK